MGSKASKPFVPKRKKDEKNRRRTSCSDQGEDGTADVCGVSSEDSGCIVHRKSFIKDPPRQHPAKRELPNSILGVQRRGSISHSWPIACCSAADGQYTYKTTQDVGKRRSLPPLPADASTKEETVQDKQADESNASGESQVEETGIKALEPVGQSLLEAETKDGKKTFCQTGTNGKMEEFGGSEFFHTKENIYTIPEEILAKFRTESEPNNTTSNTLKIHVACANKSVQTIEERSRDLPMLEADMSPPRGALGGSEGVAQPDHGDSSHVGGAADDGDDGGDEGGNEHTPGIDEQTEIYVRGSFVQRPDLVKPKTAETQPQRKSTVDHEAPVGRPDTMMLNPDKMSTSSNSHESRHLGRKVPVRAYILMKFEIHNLPQHTECTVLIVMLFGFMKLKTITKSMNEKLDFLKGKRRLEVIHWLDFPVDTGHSESKLTIGISKPQWMPPRDFIMEQTEERVIALDRFCNDSTAELTFWQRLRMTESEALNSTVATTVHFEQKGVWEIKENILQNLRELHQSTLWSQYSSSCQPKKLSDSLVYLPNAMVFRPLAFKDGQSSSGSSSQNCVDLHSDDSCPGVKVDHGPTNVRA